MALNNLPSNFTSRFSDDVATRLKAEFPNELAGLTLSQLSAFVHETVPSILPSPLTLDTTRPDYESVMAQIMSEVARTKAWRDLSLSSTGQMILRAIAADVAFGQFSIARSLQEAFPDTARASSSIYLMARMLGNRLTRNKPSYATVQLSRLTDTNTIISIPVWSSFTLNDGTSLFNRDIIVFNTDDLQLDVRLHEGLVKETTIISTGADYQTVEFGTENRLISDYDVKIFVNDAEWAQVTEPLWHYQADAKVFYENTTPNGNVSVQFGNNLYGAAPPVGAEITIKWVETKGTAGEIPASSLVVTVDNITEDRPELATLSGITVTPLASGADAPDDRFWRLFAANKRASRDRMVRRADYRSLVVGSFPRIRDAYFIGQAETNTNRPSFMNIVHGVVLADPPLSNDEWLGLQEFVADKGIFQCRLLRRDPQAVSIDIDINIFCSTKAALDVVRARATKLITEAFAPFYGSLGYSWYLSDIMGIIESDLQLQALVEYVVVDLPTADVVVANTESWIKLRNLSVTVAYTRRGDNVFEGRLDLSTRAQDVFNSGGGG